MRMKGLRLLCGLVAVGLVAAGCGASKRPNAEVQAARAYRPSLFSIFPATRGEHSCRIPIGAIGGTARGRTPGTCDTGVSTVRAFDSNGYIGHAKVAIVSFTARWQWGDSGGKAPPDPRHTWWVLEQPGSPVRVLGACDLTDGTALRDPCKSPSPFGRRTGETQLKAAFAAQGIDLARDPEPRWPRGHVGLVARGRVYVELLLRQPGVFIRPPARLALSPERYGFSRQGNVEVWWSQADQPKVKRALTTLQCDGSPVACRTRLIPASSPALLAVNRCLVAHHLLVDEFRRPYRGLPTDPGNRTVERIEFVNWGDGENTAAMVLQFGSAKDANAYVAYWRRKPPSLANPGAGARRAGATDDLAWVRDSTAWAQTKKVATCLRKRS